jgi:hypothetical protein
MHPRPVVHRSASFLVDALAGAAFARVSQLLSVLDKISMVSRCRNLYRLSRTPRRMQLR